MKNSDSRYVVIGAGPVGLAVAIFLRKLGFDVICYESRADKYVGDSESPSPVTNEELKLYSSYPIGINPRTLSCLALISEDLVQSVLQNNSLVLY